MKALELQQLLIDSNVDVEADLKRYTFTTFIGEVDGVCVFFTGAEHMPGFGPKFMVHVPNDPDHEICLYVGRDARIDALDPANYTYTDSPSFADVSDAATFITNNLT